MATYSIILKSQLEGAHRMDAEYYQPEYLENEKKIIYSKYRYYRLVDLIDPIVNGYDYREFSESGIPYIRVGNLFWGEIDNTNAVKVNINPSEIKKDIILNEGDILFSRKGTFGRTAVVEKDNVNCIISSEIMRLRINQKGVISPYYLSTFLNSKIGYLQVARKTHGISNYSISQSDLGSIKIIILDKSLINKIEELVQAGYLENKKSKLLYAQAESLLLEELGLKDFKPEDELFYVVNLSQAKSVHRIDAEYFQPKYEKLISKIKSQNSKLQGLLELNVLFTIRRGDFIAPEYYVEKAQRRYIRIKELPIKGDINIDAITYIDDNFESKNIDTVREGDFVFACIGATLGKTARIPKELEGSFYSNNISRLRLRKEWKDKIDTYYLQVVLQSMVCQLQIKKREAPTAQAKIADEELKTVLIPILAWEKQQQIADLVGRSHEARKKAKELLEQAKRMVEEEIERASQ